MRGLSRARRCRARPLRAEPGACMVLGLIAGLGDLTDAELNELALAVAVEFSRAHGTGFWRCPPLFASAARTLSCETTPRRTEQVVPCQPYGLSSRSICPRVLRPLRALRAGQPYQGLTHRRLPRAGRRSHWSPGVSFLQPKLAHAGERASRLVTLTHAGSGNSKKPSHFRIWLQDWSAKLSPSRRVTRHFSE